MSEEKHTNELNVPGDASEADSEKLLAQTEREAPSGYTGRLKNGQFAKGSSGNANGRPKKMERAWSQRQRDLDTVKEANRSLRVIENGKVEYISTEQVLIRQLLRMGVKGDIKAAKMALDRIDCAQSSREYRDREVFNEIERLESLYDEMVRMGGEAKANRIISECRKKSHKR